MTEPRLSPLPGDPQKHNKPKNRPTSPSAQSMGTNTARNILTTLRTEDLGNLEAFQKDIAQCEAFKGMENDDLEILCMLLAEKFLTDILHSHDGVLIEAPGGHRTTISNEVEDTGMYYVQRNTGEQPYREYGEYSDDYPAPVGSAIGLESFVGEPATTAIILAQGDMKVHFMPRRIFNRLSPKAKAQILRNASRKAYQELNWMSRNNKHHLDQTSNHAPHQNERAKAKEWLKKMPAWRNPKNVVTLRENKTLRQLPRGRIIFIKKGPLYIQTKDGKTVGVLRQGDLFTPGEFKGFKLETDFENPAILVGMKVNPNEHENAANALAASRRQRLQDTLHRQREFLGKKYSSLNK